MSLRTRSTPSGLALAALVALGVPSAQADGQAPPPAPAAPATAPAKPDDAAQAQQAQALQKALQVEQSLMDALAKVRRYSVSVLILQRDAQQDLHAVGCGSGVLISRNGKVWVITNAHVTKPAQALQIVASDGVTYDVELEDKVERYDISLLRFREKPKNLKGVDVKKEGSLALSEGAWVLATGNPRFLAADGQPVCTLGVISGTDRILPDEFLYGNAIQHDAEVNPGNSGGPLWNAKGDLIGINGKIATRPGSDMTNTGASFSIPIHQVAGFLPDLVKEGDTHAGYLGVDFETWTDDGGNPAGAKVAGFGRGSPANAPESKANPNPLQVGDVIQKVAFTNAGLTKSVEVVNAADLTNCLVLYPAGTKVKITYRRERKTYVWSGILAARG